MTPFQHLAILLRSLPTQVTATTLMKSPDPDMEVSLDEISGGVDEGQLDVDKRQGWGWGENRCFSRNYFKTARHK